MNPNTQLEIVLCFPYASTVANEEDLHILLLSVHHCLRLNLVHLRQRKPCSLEALQMDEAMRSCRDVQHSQRFNVTEEKEQYQFEKKITDKMYWL